jgi:hypothetical protein
MTATAIPCKKTRRRGPREKKQKSAVFLSRLDVAQLLGVGPAMVIDIEKSGQLTPYRFGTRVVRYPVAEVNALVERAKGA